MNRVYRIFSTAAAMVLAVAGARADTGEYRNLGYLYLSPLPGAEYTATQTKFVLLRFKDVAPSLVTNLSQFIQVSGASSGNHPGQTRIASDKRTVVFEMSSNFQANELVTVSLAPQLSLGTLQPYQYQFMTSGHMPDPSGASPHRGRPPESPRQDPSTPAQTLPSETPAPRTGGSSSAPAGTPAPPLAPAPPLSPAPASPGKTGILPNGVSVPSDFPHINITTQDHPDSGLIFMNNHSVGRRYNVIFDNTGSPVWYMRTADQRLDMKVQPNGMLTMVTHTGGTHFIGLNHHYEEVASYRTVNGYSVDEHELQILADGTYFLIGAHFETVDLSRYIPGGNTNAVLAENCIQQFTPTGEIIWRLGGTHNQFTYINDPLNGPSCQHTIRPLGNNRYTLFDNGNGHSPQVSRAVEYELDPT
jgi:hypothetical protein